MGLASQAKTDHSQRWWHLSSIQLAGGIISLPLIAIGGDILLADGLINAIFSIVFGNLIIFCISLCFVFMSFRKRLNAIENAEQFIGKLGSRILAFFVLATMIVWLPRQLAPANELLKIFPFFSSFNIGGVLGTVASLTLLSGIKGLKNLCTFSLIPLVFLLFAILFTIDLNASNNKMTFPDRLSFSGTSVIVSSLIASIIDFPTFFRHSNSKKDSIIALFVILVITIIVQCIGLFLYHVFLIDKSFIHNLISKEGNSAILISMFLIISIITSAAWNIYAASVGWESLFPKLKDKTEYAVIGLTATILFTSVYVGSSPIIIGSGVCDTLVSGLGGVLMFEYLRIRFFHENDLSSNICYNNCSWCLGGILGLGIFFKTSTPYYSTFVSLIVGLGTILIITQLRKIQRRFINRK